MLCWPGFITTFIKTYFKWLKKEWDGIVMHHPFVDIWEGYGNVERDK